MTLPLRRPLLLATASALLSAGLVLGGVDARAQDLSSALMMAEPGEEAEPDELEAWRLVQDGRNIKAREVAEGIVAERPDSYVGHYVLGFVYHYAETSFPRALYHENIALGLFEGMHGPAPVSPAPWRWHARILRELALTHGDLEHHAEKVAYLERYNELYDPDLIAEQAWPLMKMGRYEAARAAAERGLVEGSPRQLEVALNALCAIEFEAGNDGASYEACRVALEYGRAQPGGPNAVDLTNFAEASRSMFKLDEAERIGLEATRADMAWYGNPWVELAELYTRQGRFPEALHALEQVPPYRARRPPHVQDADRNEARRALSASPRPQQPRSQPGPRHRRAPRSPRASDPGGDVDGARGGATLLGGARELVGGRPAAGAGVDVRAARRAPVGGRRAPGGHLPDRHRGQRHHPALARR
jgi:tetratricopeptide (TPR) repeat protein